MMYQGDVVMIAMAATALLVIALTIFAFQVFFIFDNFHVEGITNETCFRRRLISQCVAASSSVSSLCFSSLDF